MKIVCIICLLLMSFEVEFISWAALVVLVFSLGWSFFLRCVDERERRYE